MTDAGVGIAGSASRAVVKAPGAAAGTGVDDADVLGATPAGAAPHAVAYVVGGARGAEFRRETMQVDAGHASTMAANGVQLEVRSEIGQAHTV